MIHKKNPRRLLISSGYESSGIKKGSARNLNDADIAIKRFPFFRRLFMNPVLVLDPSIFGKKFDWQFLLDSSSEENSAGKKV